MATIIKTWAASAKLGETAAYGGSTAVIAADQAFDYATTVDLRTSGNQGAQVQIEFRGSNSKNKLIVQVFGSLDGTVFDSEPFQSYEIRNTGKPQQISFLVEGLAYFRVGMKSSGTDTTFEYEINQQKWILTNA
ncbi:MAG: hypothetical protein IMZ61_13910 [Planctomycetes bacterium]|nr:hypothetical protein [Chloroflexota bacterium]MBE3144993.1 hypothetical protein [Planctomycetota bacterium]